MTTLEKMAQSGPLSQCNRRKGENETLFLWFLNDFYEEWLPVAGLGLLVAQELAYVRLLGAKVLLFLGFLVNFIRDSGKSAGF